MLDFRNIWKSHTIGRNQTLELALGPLHMWMYRGEQELHIAHEMEHGNDERCAVSVFEGALSQERDWTRWILDKGVECVQFKPRLPDRPLIVRPEMPMYLMPKQSVQFFVGIPIWLAITLGARHKQAIEVPSLALSNSWFGPFTEGELCYAMKTTAKLHQQDLIPSAYRAVFPLEVRNASPEKLNFERLCIRPQYLNIFQGETRLWTSKGRVSYRGEENWSRIIYSSHAPEFDQAGRLLGKARETMQRGAFLKTFDNFKQRVEI